MLNFIAILDFVENHPYYAAIALSAGTILASEMIWRAIKFLGQKKKPLRINEVVIFNEFGEDCSSVHYHNIRLGKPNLPCDNPYCSDKGVGKMAHQIDQAVYAIDAAIYSFTSVALLPAFKRALRRGVTVRIISDKEMVFSSDSQINELAFFGVAVRGPVHQYLMHHKFVVIDGEERVEEIKRLRKRKWMRPSSAVALSGSVNWTRSGFRGNWENCIITNDKVLTDAFQAEFSHMWKSFDRAPDTK